MLQRALIFFSIVFFSSCYKSSVIEKITPIHQHTLDFEEEDIYIRKSDNPISGHYYIKVDSTNVYAKGFSFRMPDSLKKQHVKISLDFYAKLGLKRFGQSVVIALNSNGQNIVWAPIDLGPLTFKKDKWFQVKDSIQFYFDPYDTSKHFIQVFGFNPHKFSTLSLDDLKIKIDKIEYFNKKP